VEAITRSMGRLLMRRSFGIFSTSATTSPLRSRPLGCQQRQANERIDSRRSRTGQLADSPAWQRKCAAPLPAVQPSASSLFPSARRAQRLTRPNSSHGGSHGGKEGRGTLALPAALAALALGGASKSRHFRAVATDPTMLEEAFARGGSRHGPRRASNGVSAIPRGGSASPRPTANKGVGPLGPPSLRS
jgi:hypothetical protein